MNIDKLSGASIVLICTLIFSACSPAKIASIEKRRYRNGYHVQMKHNPAKAEAAKRTIEASETKAEFAGLENAESSTEKRVTVKKEVKKIKEVIKTFKKNEGLKEFIASADDLIIVDTRKNQASIPARQTRTNDILSPTDTKGGIIGVLLLLILVAFLAVYLIATTLALILVIAIAVIIGIVLSVILKAVGLIGD